MGNVLNDLEPKRVFYYFEEVSQIPRGSRDVKRISDYCVEFAKKHNLECYQDSALNIVIIKPASKGYENLPTVIIQGHMDMVCEKNLNSNHDFTKDPIRLRIDGDYIHAQDTTLGADDGIAMAYAFAILESDNILHPRLEVIFTVDEEIGMLGAAAFEPINLLGKYMLNIDSDDEGIFLTSCAGGNTSVLKLPYETQSITGLKYKINISGLKGGHSGAEIDKYRANAIILLSRLMLDLQKDIKFWINNIWGGLKDNAIPREAYLEIVIDEEAEDKLIELIEKYNQMYQKEYRISDSNLKITATKDKKSTFDVLTSDSYNKFLLLFTAIPNGIEKMSLDIEGLVESSLNIGILRLEDNCIVMTFSVRSSIGSYKGYLSDKISYLVRALGGNYSVSGDYPEWEYNPDSTLRELIKDVYKELYNIEPVFTAIHAGLECGILSNKIKGLDIISFGPNALDIHTPDERLSISSTQNVYKFLLKVLESFINY